MPIIILSLISSLFFFYHLKRHRVMVEKSVSKLFRVRMPSFPGNCIGNCRRHHRHGISAFISFRFVSFRFDSIPIRIEELLFQIWVRIVK